MGTALGRIEVEQPAYQVLKKTADYEIRRYPAIIRAQVAYSGGDLTEGAGFRDLANYIFGGNRSRDGTTQAASAAVKIAMTAPVITEPAAAEKSEKIAMTAPVITEQQTAGNMQMSFVLPSQYTSLQQLPEPNNPRVQLIQVPESTYAAVQFTGAPGQQELDQRLSQLKQSLAADAEVKVPAEARPLYCRYNPPWTPWFLRTNELLLGVDYTS